MYALEIEHPLGQSKSTPETAKLNEALNYLNLTLIFGFLLDEVCIYKEVHGHRQQRRRIYSILSFQFTILQSRSLWLLTKARVAMDQTFFLDRHEPH